MEIESGGNWARVFLSGGIDMSWLETHQEQIDRLCDSTPIHVVVDLEAVTFMDTTGLALIGFATYPLMPPRLLPSSYGFVDTLRVYGGLWSFDSGTTNCPAGAPVAISNIRTTEMRLAPSTVSPSLSAT